MAGQKNLRNIEPLINLKQASSLSGPNRTLIPCKVFLKSLQIHYYNYMYDNKNLLYLGKRVHDESIDVHTASTKFLSTCWLAANEDTGNSLVGSTSHSSSVSNNVHIKSLKVS